METTINKAALYFIAPFHIKDPDIFFQGLEEKKWKRNLTYSRHSVNKEVATFLGWENAVSFPKENGLAYTLQRLSSGIKELSSLNNKLIAIDPKGNTVTDIGADFELDTTVKLNIAPNRLCGIIMLRINSSDLTLQQAVNLNYTLHKNDKKQAVRIVRKPTSQMLVADENGKSAFDRLKENSCTLLELIRMTLPSQESYYLDNENRFITSNCFILDKAPDANDNLIQTSLLQLSMAKNEKYLLPANMRNDIFDIFENIKAAASIEGFTVFAFNQDNESSTFIKNFLSTFESSYLPNYLLVLLVDLVFVGSLRNIDEVAVNMQLQDHLITSRLVASMSTSHYEHLNRLVDHMMQKFLFDKKYTFILESIKSRKENIEREATRREENYEKNINMLIGIIGLGQVIFAIIELIGVNKIFGHAVSEGLAAWWFAILSCGFFMLLIAGVLIYIGWGQRNSNK